MTNVKNIVLLVSIAVMVVISALAASHTPIYWEYFGLSVIILAGLIFLQKREIKKEINEGIDSGFNYSKFKDTVEKLRIELKKISEKEIDNDYSENLITILENYLPDMDDYRINIINKFSVADYTKITIPFSQAERLINRGHSAAVDGYFVESQESIKKALSYLDLLTEEMELIKSDKNV